MPRCDRCGVEAPEGAKYCMACGHRTGVAATSVTPPPPVSGGSSANLSQADRILSEAFTLSDEGRLTEAVRLAQQALRHNPGSTTAHSLLGTLYERLGDRDSAIREYQSVLTLSPGSTADRQRLNELLGLPAAPKAPKPIFPKFTRRSDTPQAVIIAVVFCLVAAGVVILWQITNLRSAGNKLPSGGATPTKITGAISAAPRAAVTLPNSPDLGFGYNPLPVPGLPMGPSSPQATTEAGAVPGGGPPLPAQNPSPDAAEIPPLPEEDMPQVLELPEMNNVLRQDDFPPEGGKILSRPPAVSIPNALLPTAEARLQATLSLQEARQLVVAGRLQEASRAYEASLQVQPASPKTREELATVYFRLQDPKKAADNFVTAYTLYYQQFQSGGAGIDTEAARHGLATCRAALQALGYEVP